MDPFPCCMIIANLLLLQRRSQMAALEHHLKPHIGLWHHHWSWCHLFLGEYIFFLGRFCIQFHGFMFSNPTPPTFSSLHNLYTGLSCFNLHVSLILLLLNLIQLFLPMSTSFSLVSVTVLMFSGNLTVSSFLVLTIRLHHGQSISVHLHPLLPWTEPN